MNIEELERRFTAIADEVDLSTEHQVAVLALLEPLKKGPEGVRTHYAHSLRVGLKAQEIAAFTHHERKPLLIAGVAHDVGKCHIPFDVLAKTSDWTEADALVMEEHVIAGHQLLHGRFDFSAEIMLWHHKFQKNGYPKVLPPPLHEYAETTKLLIVEYGRLLALADVYDALHRTNDKFKGDLDGERIRDLMFQLNPDRTQLVAGLYETGVFSV